MARTLSHSIVLLVAVLFCGQAFGQGAAAPLSSWHGKYSNANLQFELKPTPFGGLTGTLTFKGNVYVAIVRVSGEKLTGTFRTGNGSFPYEATRNGNELRFVTGDTEYLLRREGASAAAQSNPLARNKSPMQPPSAAPAPPGQAVQLSPGCSVRLPAGWTSKESSDGFIFLPAGVSFDPSREDNSEVYLAALRNDYDPSEEAQTVQQLSAAVALSGGRGGQRQSVTFGQRPGAIYRWELPNPQSSEMSAFDIYLVPEGTRALVLIAVGEKARVRSNDPSVRQILASIALAAPPEDAGGITAAPKAAASGPLADSTPLARRWLEKLRGKVVRQFWASQGMSSDKRHWLYADGTYAFKSSSMVSVDVPGAGALSTGRDNSTGRWRIRDLSGQVFLEVSYNNGNVQRMRITEDNRNWYLNGEKAFAVNPE
jgi:hypothetical protein